MSHFIIKKITNLIKVKSAIFSFAMIGSLLMSGNARAQLNAFQSVYFQNQYLANPAMAGLDKGLNLNLGYQKQVSNIPGQQKLQSFTADYGLGKNVGIGILVNNEQAGLISRTKVMGTYAYHLPVSAEGRLNFGVSLGVNDRYLDYGKIVGDAADLQAQNFNQKNIYLDGDLGVSYTGKALTLQAALPNLKTAVFNGDSDGSLAVDRATYYAAGSYKFLVKGEASIEPKLAVRGVKGFDDIFDAGANLNLKAYGINVLAMYHTTKSGTFGFGLDLKTVDLLLTYTTSTSQLQGYSNNMFEMGLKLRLFNNK